MINLHAICQSKYFNLDNCPVSEACLFFLKDAQYIGLAILGNDTYPVIFLFRVGILQPALPDARTGAQRL